MDTAGSNHTLLLFCKFLVHSVRTENLELLYNIAVDVLDDPPCFTRVEEMVYKIFPLVAILPTEITDPVIRAKADKLLNRMRERDVDEDEENELSSVHTALRDRIQLKNWDVLEEIYDDFKIGRDRTLCSFAALQPEAITILPIRPSKSKSNSVDNSPDATKAGCDFHSKRCANIRMVENEMKPEAGRLEAYNREITQSSLKPFTTFRKNSPPSVNAIAGVIRAELDTIEASEPWRRVYDISKIVYPFDKEQHPTLAERFRRFWNCHARAVWQRHFWCRVPGDDRGGKHTAVLNGDKNAAKSFEDLVLRPLFGKFGAAFFLDLDARRTRLHWWWYREAIVDLVQMATVMGVEYCTRYMRTQNLKPHPTPHPQFHRNTMHRESPSPSMWATTKMASPILDAMIALQERRARRSTKATKNRKRARVVWSDSEEGDNE